MVTATAVKTARDHCLAPSWAIDAPLEGASGRYRWRPTLPARGVRFELTDLLVPVE
jgi:hypothetical protein